MIKFFHANFCSPPQENINSIGVEPYNINIEYVITSDIVMSTIPDSKINVDA